MANVRAQDSRVAETTATGISLLNWSGDEPHSVCLAAFLRLGVPFNGRPGGRGRETRRCSNGKANSRSVAHPISLGLAVKNRNWSNTMCKNTPTPPWGTFLYQRAHDVSSIVSDARHIASTIADIIPVSTHNIRIEELGRVQALASAVARLMQSAEDAAYELASEMQDAHSALINGDQS